MKYDDHDDRDDCDDHDDRTLYRVHDDSDYHVNRSNSINLQYFYKTKLTSLRIKPRCEADIRVPSKTRNSPAI